MSLVKMRSVGWALNQCDPCPYKKRKFGHRDMHSGRMPWTEGTEAAIRVMLLKAKDHQRQPANQQKLGEGPGADSPRSPQKLIPLAALRRDQSCQCLDLRPPEQWE